MVCFKWHVSEELHLWCHETDLLIFFRVLSPSTVVYSKMVVVKKTMRDMILQINNVNLSDINHSKNVVVLFFKSSLIFEEILIFYHLDKRLASFNLIPLLGSSVCFYVLAVNTVHFLLCT